MSDQYARWPHIRRVESVVTYPAANIICWSVREATFWDGDKSRHLVGFIPGRTGRVTSAIQRFCPEKRKITTQSGRVYTLVGMPGRAEDGDYVWKYWSKGNNVIHDIDVTDEYAKQIRSLVM